MALQLSFSNEIPDIYFISNSASSLVRMMRGNYFIQHELASIPSEELIKEFNEKIKNPIGTTKELAELYAIYIALTFKEKYEVEDFFEEKRKIKFEWFSTIADMYFNNYIAAPVIQYGTDSIVNTVQSPVITTEGEIFRETSK